MVDVDGKFTYSKTVSVRLNNNDGIISVYPNPAVNDITIALQHPLKDGSRLKVTDIAGRELINQTVTATQNNIKLATNQLPAGRYFITVINNDAILHESFVIVR